MTAVLDDARAPIHLHVHRLKDGVVLRLEPTSGDCTGFVWKGALRAGQTALAAGSSLIVERGAVLEVAGCGNETLLLTFTAKPSADELRRGGHVHLLPVESVPRYGDGRVGGGLHADAMCATCSVWLHENRLAAPAQLPSYVERAAGVHSHTEDEVIFVTDGQIRLGNRLYGPGVAIAIPADTLYGFIPGPDGLKFVNFRAGAPGDISFADGRTMNEMGYWRGQLDAPDPITFAAPREHGDGRDRTMVTAP